MRKIKVRIENFDGTEEQKREIEARYLNYIRSHFDNDEDAISHEYEVSRGRQRRDIFREAFNHATEGIDKIEIVSSYVDENEP